MKVVIQCAGKKSAGAGSFLLEDERKVAFVASPSTERPPENSIYARPDDVANAGHETWRERLVAYNKAEAALNPLQLLPAYKLYMNPAYQRLVRTFGENKVFILSAGWGLIPAGFLTPTYDITLSSTSPPLNRRKPQDCYNDFNLMEDDGEEVIFLGGKSYLPLFHSLTEKISARKIVFYNSKMPPRLSSPNTKMVRFETSTRTNWHYECAADLVSKEFNQY